MCFARYGMKWGFDQVLYIDYLVYMCVCMCICEYAILGLLLGL